MGVRGEVKSPIRGLIVGFHGCDAYVFDEVVRHGGELRPSTNNYDWLGEGIYFWEDNYNRALDWAKGSVGRKGSGSPAVIGALLALGNCLNLTDSACISMVKDHFEILRQEHEATGIPMPENSGKPPDKLLRRLDRYIIDDLYHWTSVIWDEGVFGSGGEMLVQPHDPSFTPFDSARGLFSEGEPIYESSGFKERTHVQVCVKNPNCIIGYFEPRKLDANYRVF